MWKLYKRLKYYNRIITKRQFLSSSFITPVFEHQPSFKPGDLPQMCAQHSVFGRSTLHWVRRINLLKEISSCGRCRCDCFLQIQERNTSRGKVKRCSHHGSSRTRSVAPQDSLQRTLFQVQKTKTASISSSGSCTYLWRHKDKGKRPAESQTSVDAWGPDEVFWMICWWW